MNLIMNEDGWVQGVVQRQSEHFNARPDGERISLIVLHYISLPAGSFEGNDIDDLFMGRLECSKRAEYADLKGLRVSSHFVIRRTGEIRQYVSLNDRAWHAGVSVFEGREGCNDFSVGIELEGTGEVPFEKAQYDSLARILPLIIENYPIEAVTGHEFIAPGRKTDPGPFMDWEKISSIVGRSVRVVIERQA